MADQETSPTLNTKIQIPLDYRLLSIAFALVIAVLLMVWQPWYNFGVSNRTVSVTGTAKLKAEPDQFLFVPTYEIKNTDRTAGLKAVAAKSDEVVAGLKKLGIEDKDIKNNSNGYEAITYPSDKTGDSEEMVYQINLTVTVYSREQAQRVQDYLLTTNPSGQITPVGQFSDGKQKELEDKAREEANKDARTKADKSAKSLGYKLGKVKSVEDGTGFGGPIAYEGKAVQLDAATSGPLTLQPGQDEVYYSVTVVYFVR